MKAIGRVTLGIVPPTRKRGRHSSGEVEPIFAAIRERRRRGARAALDWNYEFRTYLGVVMGLFCAVVGGVDLLDGDRWWEPIAGALLLVCAATAIGLLVRWILRPVDPESKARLDQFHESMRWRNIFKK